jgi:iron complex transport system ATP-binding protein
MPKLMMVDEPSAHLDLKYKTLVMEMLADISRKGITVLMASHDINLVTKYCDKVLLLSKGKILDYGPPGEVVTPDSIREVFEVETSVVQLDGVLYVLPTGSKSPKRSESA